MIRGLTLLASLLCLVATGARAQTVDEILKRGKLIAGISMTSPPRSHLNAQMQPEGIDVEFAQLLAKHLGVPLEITDVTQPNRIPLLLNKKVDIIVSGFISTPERATQVAFSDTYSMGAIVVVAPQSTAIKTIADTAGMKIAVTRGNVMDTAYTAIAPPNTQILRFDDSANMRQAVLSGQADAAVDGDANVRELIKSAPDKHLETKLTISISPLAVGMRRGQQDFLNWINTCIFYMKYSGELAALHKKYDMSYDLPVF